MHLTNLRLVNFLYHIATSSSIGRLTTLILGKWLSPLVAFFFLGWMAFIWARYGELTMLIQTAFAVIFSRLLLEVLRLCYKNCKRPFNALNIQPVFRPFENGSSFPSSHAVFHFALAAVGIAYSMEIGLALFVAALVIGLGRIAAAVHWPTDILVGAVLGILSGYIAQSVTLLF